MEEINTDIGNDENCFENEKVKNKEAYCFRKENNRTEVDKAEYVDSINYSSTTSLPTTIYQQRNVLYALKKANTCAEYVGTWFVFFSAPSKTQNLIMRATWYIRKRILKAVN